MNKMMFHSHLTEYIKNYCKDEGITHTSIPSLKFYITSDESQFRSIIYEPSLCIALQGEKAIGFGDNLYGYSPSQYLLACTNIPANVKINKASKEHPFISLAISFTTEQIYEVLKDTNSVKTQNKKKLEDSFCFNSLDEELLEPISRLVRLLDKPQQTIDFMYPLLIKEIIYVLLENNSEFLKHYVLEGTITNQIVKAISQIKNNYNEIINMSNLAKEIGISEASLYQNFKKITLMSPLQYQKKIRLEEAKHMLANQNIEASSVAFAVGYESPSQFSREYTRMFGMSPKAHSNKLKSEIA